MTLRKLLAPCAMLLLYASAQAAEPLFFRMGGEAKLKPAMDELVAVMLEDERINFVFAQTDLTKFKHLLYTQLCELAGGPCIYDGRDMRTAHRSEERRVGKESRCRC